MAIDDLPSPDQILASNTTGNIDDLPSPDQILESSSPANSKYNGSGSASTSEKLQQIINKNTIPNKFNGKPVFDASTLTGKDAEEYQRLKDQEAAEFGQGAGRAIEHVAGAPFSMSGISPGSLSTSFEKNIVAPVGDFLTGNDTSELYANRTPEQLENTYNQQIQQGQQASPTGTGFGQMLASIPLYEAGGAAAGTVAKGIGNALGTGALATGEAANALTTGQKLGQAAINIPAQAIGAGGLAARQAYTDNPYATPEEKQSAALKAGIFGSLIGGGGAALSEAPGVISSMGKNTSNKLLTNAALGAEGVNTATAAGREAITQQGEALASKVAGGVTDLNQTLGKQAAADIKDTFASTAKAADTSVENIVTKVANNLDIITKTSGQAATDIINNSFAEALKKTGEQQGLTGIKLTSFIQDGLKTYGPIISSELEKASAMGVTIPMDENFLKTFLSIKNAKVALSEATNVQEKLWKNWADTLYTVSENTAKETVKNIGGFTQKNIQIKGEGQLPSQLPKPSSAKGILEQTSFEQPTTPEIQPGVNAPLTQNVIKNAQTEAGSMQSTYTNPGSKLPETTVTPTSGQSITRVNQTFTPKTEIPVAEAKQFSNALGNIAGNPNLEEIQPLAADLASQLRNSIKQVVGSESNAASEKYFHLKQAMNEMGVPKVEREAVTGSNITPEGITGFIQKAAKMADEGNTATLDRVFNHLNEVDPKFAAGFKTEVDKVSEQFAALKKAQNASVENKALTLQQQGLANPQVNQASQTLQDIGNVQKEIGTSVPQIRRYVNDLNPSDIKSPAEMQRTLDFLRKVDPDSAKLLESKMTQSTIARNQLLQSGANKSPLDQATILQQTSQVGPLQTTKAAQTLENLDVLNKKLGQTTSTGTPSDTTRDFIKNYGISKATPSGSATSADIEGVVQKLASVDPTLAATVRTEAPVIGRKLRAIDYGESASPFGSIPAKAIGGIGPMIYKGSNLIGQASRLAAPAGSAAPLATAGISSLVNAGMNAAPGTKQNAAASEGGKAFSQDSLNQLSTLVKTSPQTLGEFAGPLQAAASRGMSSLAALNFAYYMQNPAYRAIIDPLQAEAEKRQSH